jgi:acyl carrier protein
MTTTETPTEQPPTAALQHVLTAAARVFRREVRGEDNFFAVGGDSIDAVELAVTVEELTQREVPTELVFETPTFGALAAAIDRGAR